MPSKAVDLSVVPVIPVQMKCRNCEGTNFAGPFQYGTVTDDHQFHPDPAATQVQCLGCHALQPFKDLRPWISPASVL